MAIKPKTDPKPGGESRFAALLNPERAMAAAAEDTVKLTQKPVGEPKENQVPISSQNAQSLRVDKGVLLRLKSLQLKREMQGERKTLMELANEALDAFLTTQGE